MSTLPTLRSTIASSSRTSLLRGPSQIIPKPFSPRSPISPSLTRQIHTRPLSLRLHFQRTKLTLPLKSIKRPFSSTPLRSNTNTTSSSSSNSNQSESEPSGVTGKLKLLFKKYGWYALGIYTLLSTVDCSLTFIAVHTLGAEKIEPIFDGVIQFYRVRRYGEDEAENMKKIDEEKKEQEIERAKLDGSVEKEKNKWFGKTFWAELALAYAIHKTLLLPVRAGLTVAWTPKIVNWLTSRGWVGKVSWIVSLIFAVQVAG
uniref:DUF1279 domain-containing protein n=1 Tax=Kwoniella bestiolae CBS 10118 TaxID=1296100 RepID=A0A1B9GFY4_9TREE|nr:hypothetical protein I302_01358 [Kwoniella bestiolae CBS 10118]OCF29845.1 hypothetical protein I302_01358 [Kwoniella bestiolae CBS 10118]